MAGLAAGAATDQLPAEYINSALFKESIAASTKKPATKSEQEFEDEIQLALAISQSEAEAQESMKRKKSSIINSSKSSSSGQSQNQVNLRKSFIVLKKKFNIINCHYF